MQRVSHIADLPDISRTHASATDAVRHAVSELSAALSGTNQYWRKGRGPIYWQLRRDLPYVVHEISVPGAQILLNRQWKPLGSNVPDGGAWALYEGYPNQHTRLTPAQIAGICAPSERCLQPETWDASCWAGYLRRLNELLDALAQHSTGP